MTPAWCHPFQGRIFCQTAGHDDCVLGASIVIAVSGAALHASVPVTLGVANTESVSSSHVRSASRTAAVLATGPA